jgi:hypothetical protein
MIDSARLLVQARELSAPRRGAPHQSDLRRAVSSAYYALFHHVARTASDALVGSTVVHRKRPEYRLVYRSLQHALMAEVCEVVRRPKLPPRYERACGFSTFGQEVKSCAAAFADLQTARHAADYDPAHRLTRGEVALYIAVAEQAMQSLVAAPEAERRVFLHLLVFRSRD